MARKKPLRLMFEGNRSRNRIHYENWKHPVPVDGSYVRATAVNTVIRGRVQSVSWVVKGETDAMGDVEITVFVDDIASDNNSLDPSGKPKKE